jgi:hypothetical protein
MKKMLAMTVPILPGKTEQWKKFAKSIMGEKSKEFKESRNRLGIRERIFLQHTPMGDFVIATFEGENPEEFITKFGQGKDAFTQWFLKGVQETSGMDLSTPLPGPVPELFIDSGALVHEMSN